MVGGSRRAAFHAVETFFSFHRCQVGRVLESQVVIARHGNLAAVNPIGRVFECAVVERKGSSRAVISEVGNLRLGRQTAERDIHHVFLVVSNLVIGNLVTCLRIAFRRVGRLVGTECGVGVNPLVGFVVLVECQRCACDSRAAASDVTECDCSTGSSLTAESRLADGNGRSVADCVDYDCIDCGRVEDKVARERRFVNRCAIDESVVGDLVAGARCAGAGVGVGVAALGQGRRINFARRHVAEVDAGERVAAIGNLERGVVGACGREDSVAEGRAGNGDCGSLGREVACQDCRRCKRGIREFERALEANLFRRFLIGEEVVGALGLDEAVSLRAAVQVIVSRDTRSRVGRILDEGRRQVVIAAVEGAARHQAVLVGLGNSERLVKRKRGRGQRIRRNRDNLNLVAVCVRGDFDVGCCLCSVKRGGANERDFVERVVERERVVCRCAADRVTCGLRALALVDVVGEGRYRIHAGSCEAVAEYQLVTCRVERCAVLLRVCQGCRVKRDLRAVDNDCTFDAAISEVVEHNVAGELEGTAHSVVNQCRGRAGTFARSDLDKAVGLGVALGCVSAAAAFSRRERSLFIVDVAVSDKVVARRNSVAGRGNANLGTFGLHGGESCRIDFDYAIVGIGDIEPTAGVIRVEVDARIEREAVGLGVILHDAIFCFVAVLGRARKRVRPRGGDEGVAVRPADCFIDCQRVAGFFNLDGGTDALRALEETGGVNRDCLVAVGTADGEVTCSGRSSQVVFDVNRSFAERQREFVLACSVVGRYGVRAAGCHNETVLICALTRVGISSGCVAARAGNHGTERIGAVVGARPSEVADSLVLFVDGRVEFVFGICRGGVDSNGAAVCQSRESVRTDFDVSGLGTECIENRLNRDGIGGIGGPVGEVTGVVQEGDPVRHSVIGQSRGSGVVCHEACRCVVARHAGTRVRDAAEGFNAAVGTCGLDAVTQDKLVTFRLQRESGAVCR